MKKSVTDKEVEAYLIKKHTGKLFVDISLLKIMGNSYTINKDWYTVIDGKVCMVNDGRQDFTGDTLLSLETQCKRVGVYDPKKVYKRMMKEFTYAQFKKRIRF